MKTVRQMLAFCVAASLALAPLSAFAQGAPAKVAEVWFSQGRVADISVTTASAASVLPTAGFMASICNTGSNDAFLSFGTNAAVATVAAGSWLKAGTCGAYDLYPIGAATRQTYVAAITGSSTTTLRVETGSGSPPNALGSSSSGGSTTIVGPLGQAASAASIPVVLPNDPDGRPSTGNITIQDTGSSSTTGQNGASIVTGSPTAASTQSTALNGRSAARILITGTWTGTLAFEGSIDSGTTWTALPNRVSGSSYTQGSVTSNGLFYTDTSALTNLRVRATAAVTGTAVIRFVIANDGSAVQILNPLRLFDNTSGMQASIIAPGTAAASADNAVTTSDGAAQQWADTPTVQNAAYASTNCVGGFRAITVTEQNGQAALLTNIRVLSLGGGTETLTLYAFDSNPSASTCTDKSTFTLNSADVDKLIAPPSSLTLVAPTGTSISFASVDFSPARPFRAGGSSASGVKTYYLALVSGSTFTPATTSDIHTRTGTVMLK